MVTLRSEHILLNGECIIRLLQEQATDYQQTQFHIDCLRSLFYTIISLKTSHLYNKVFGSMSECGQYVKNRQLAIIEIFKYIDRIGSTYFDGVYSILPLHSANLILIALKALNCILENRLLRP